MSELIVFLQQNDKRILLLVNKYFIDHEHYRIRPYYDKKIPSVDATAFAFQTLNDLRILNKIYESDSLTVYIDTKEHIGEP